MMKWLRTHTKQIMAFLVLVAMFSFVGGSALVKALSPDPSKEPYGTAFGKEFNYQAIREAQRDVHVLETISMRSPAAKAQYGELWQCGRKDLMVQHWYLLELEAERAGIQVSDKEIDDQMESLPANFLEHLRTGPDRITPGDIRHALGRHLAIEKNSRRITNAAVPSEIQIRHFVRDTEDKVKARLVALDAEKFIDEKEPVSEAELQAQYDKYKDAEPSKDESGFGYKFPQRVKLQYVVARIPQIAAGVEISQEAIRSTWKANKAKYKKVIYVEPPTSAPAPATSGPASQPEKPKPVPKTVEKSFSEAQADVERDLRQKAAQQSADQAMRKIQGQLQKPWLGEKSDTSGYKPIPSAAKAPQAMKEVCERIAAEFKIPIEYGETPLVSREELAKLPKIGGTALAGGAAAGGGENLRIEDYAFRNPQFYKHAAGTETLPSLQLFQVPEAPLSDAMQFQSITMPANKLVLFRVIEARESEAPASLDEVRAAVEHDVRLLKAFSRIEPTAKELLAVSERLGVEKAMDLFPDLKEKRDATVITPPPFARMTNQFAARMRQKASIGEPMLVPSNVPGVGTSKEFIDACFDMTAPGWKAPAMELPKTDRMRSATTRPAMEPAPKVQLISLPKVHKWVVVELTGTEQVDEGKYESQYRQMAYYSLMTERGLALRDHWFNPEEVEKRCGFHRLGGDDNLTPVHGVGSEEHPPPAPYI